MLAREPEHAEALRNMHAIWIDSGRSDEYHLDLGAIAFHREVVAPGDRRTTACTSSSSRARTAG